MTPSAAIYDPHVAATPEVKRQMTSVQSARARIAAAGKLFVSNPGLTPESAPEEPKEVAPRMSPGEWAERQREIYRNREPWFRIVDEIDPPRAPRIEDVQRATCHYFGISRSDMLSARRTANIVRPRQIGYYLAKSLTLRSLPEIGRRFGGRDHTSALSGIRKIERLRKTDAKLDADLHAIAASIGVSLEPARIA